MTVDRSRIKLLAGVGAVAVISTMGVRLRARAEPALRITVYKEPT
jgi:hypothetical protein